MPNSRRDSRFVRSTVFSAFAVAAAIFGSGCAVDQSAQIEQKKTLDALQERVEEVERTNGRITVRMEELEDQLFLLNDRVESHRIALQRRAYRPNAGQRQQYAAAPQAPRQAPESYYYGAQGRETEDGVYEIEARRPVRRIRIGAEDAVDTAPREQPRSEVRNDRRREAEDEGEIVISDSDFREFAGTQRAPARAPKVATAGSKSSGRAPQPSVTSEKLTPSGAATKKPVVVSDKPTPSKVSAPKSSGLRLYKDSLASYRAGEYGAALAGFEKFLDSKPKDDYVDNALYWIGECHYGLGEFDASVRTFERVIREQPDGNKVPDSMLKMSLALDKLGRQDRSRQVLETLTQRYPMTNAARLGQKRLAEK